MEPDNNCNHQKVGFKKVISMMWVNCDNKLWKILWTILLFAIFVFIALYLNLYKNSDSELSNVFVTVFSCMLGFVIAGYAIILSLGKEVLCILTKPFVGMENAEKQKSPFIILSANFSYCCLICCLTVIVSMFYNHCCVMFYIIMFFASYTFILVFDLILHLYSTSSYISKCKKIFEDKKNTNQTNSEQ
ncbi:MAG: hypothetical protein K6A96_10355 [Prevotella sp.]|nr:hypothetical protein [Prevotella sp.]